MGSKKNYQGMDKELKEMPLAEAIVVADNSFPLLPAGWLQSFGSRRMGMIIFDFLRDDETGELMKVNSTWRFWMRSHHCEEYMEKSAAIISGLKKNSFMCRTDSESFCSQQSPAPSW